MNDGAFTDDELAAALAAVKCDGVAGHSFTSVSIFGFVARKLKPAA